MPITPPPDPTGSYHPPVTLTWSIADNGILYDLPLTFDITMLLEDDDLTVIAELVETRLKAKYPDFKIERLVGWKASAPPHDTRIVIQEPAVPEPEPEGEPETEQPAE